MSRWTVPTLTAMTEQQVFDACAYHMLAHGGSPRELLLKPESRAFNRRRSWGYFVRQKRAPRHASLLIADLEEIHRNTPPEEWASALDNTARAYGLQSHDLGIDP